MMVAVCFMHSKRSTVTNAAASWLAVHPALRLLAVVLALAPLAALLWPPGVWGVLETSLSPCLPRLPAICAHRGNAEEAGIKDDLIPSMRELWRRGVTCMDIDGVLTADGDIVVGHPASIADAIAANASAAGTPRAGFSQEVRPAAYEKF